MPPLLSIAPAARSATCVFSEPSRSEAEKTRKETGSRAWPSAVAISPESCVGGAYSGADAIGKGSKHRSNLGRHVTH
jgi:hypothetical protein